MTDQGCDLRGVGAGNGEEVGKQFGLAPVKSWPRKAVNIVTSWKAL